MLEFLKRKKLNKSDVEIGQSGTDYFSGMINEEYNPDLRGQQGIKKYDEMRKSDGQVYACLQAVKLPLMQAKWYIQPAVCEEESEANNELYEEQAEFIERMLINDLQFNNQISKILTFLDFGFKYLEKVYGLDDDGRIVWKKLGDRQQTAHYKWESDDQQVGALQMPTNPYKIEDGYANYEVESTPFIPMSKLLLFSYQREGDNYEGVSLLRPIYKHYYYKDLFYKIQGMSCERYGVGVPWIQLGNNYSAKEKSEAENLGRNFRSNQTGYLITPGTKEDGMNIEILGPTGDAKSQDIREAISEHNRMMTMAILAPFLDLGSGSSGSYSLGEVQLNFYMHGIQSIANVVKATINDGIKELILLNWADTKVFPTLEVTDLTDTDEDKFAMTLKHLVEAGLLDRDDNLKKYIRDNLKLPELPDDFVPEEPVGVAKEDDEERDEEDDKEEEETRKNSQPKKKRIFMSERNTSTAEKVFTKAINENERIISEHYNLFYKELREIEKQVKAFLKNKYSKANTRMDGTVKRIKNSDKLFNDIKSGVNDIFKKFNRTVNGKALSKKLMKDVARLAIVTSSELNKARNLADEFDLPIGKIKSFLGGHISNIDGVVFNESRHIMERVHDNIRQEASQALVMSQVDKLKLNRNTYKLSVTAHPRALFRNVVTDEFLKQAKKEGKKIVYFKILVPTNRINRLTPGGKTLGVAFMIMTAQQLNKRGNVKENTDVAGGLGLHHNSYEYALPIEWSEEEEELARQQRAELIQQVELNNQ